MYKFYKILEEIKDIGYMLLFGLLAIIAIVGVIAIVIIGWWYFFSISIWLGLGLFLFCIIAAIFETFFKGNEYK